MPRIHGLYDEPNSQFEIWGTPNENVFSEFGQLELSGQASGSLNASGLSGAALGALSGGGGSPAAPAPSGSTWASLMSGLRNRFLATQRQPPRPMARAPLPAARAMAIPPGVVPMYNRRPNPSRSRAMLLEPNLGSTVKVERFVFALSQVITALGTGQAIAMRDTPDTNIRPQRVTANAPSVGFVILSSIRVGNVDAVVGSSVDAFDFNANGQGQSLDMPTLKTATKLTVDGTYTGLVPSPLTGTGPYTFTVSFKGPSTLTA